MSKATRLKAYQKMIRGLLGFCAGLYEFVTGEDAPNLKDVLT